MKHGTYKSLKYAPCEQCGSEEKTMWRFWCRQWLCTNCAHKSFKTWIAKATATATAIALIIFLAV